jgi:pyruvate/2-oxoglutarate/acetoin dehydrogenase E1 component
LKDISIEKRIEFPVCEELQLGMSIGLSFLGYLPISIIQRMDFLLRAADQIVNHLDLIAKLSRNAFSPKIIIRTTIGSTSPLDCGLQHSKDLTAGFQKLVSFPIFKVTTVKEVKSAYKFARECKTPVMIVEDQNLYNV